MNIIELFDAKATPDIFYEYTDALRNECTPLVIDNGSYKCRVGWSSNEKPLLEFRNLIAKPRKDRKKDAPESQSNPPLQIGNDIVNIEAMRLQLKNQFDRNIVTHYHNQEQIFDYIFAHLGLNEEQKFNHPILFTEALCHPNYCRQQMNELFFECYNVPAVCYGLDFLFSWQKNENAHKRQAKDSLIIAFGYHTTHVVPILNGRLMVEHVRRLNLGGYHIITYLYRLMQMKYPVHLNSITISRMETLLHEHSYVVVDYKEALKKWAQGDFYEENVKKIQLKYTAPVQNTTLTIEQKLERRKELARRLTEVNARRAREKQQEDEQQLEFYNYVRSLYDAGHIKKFERTLKDQEIANLQALEKLITTVRTRLERTKQKLQEALQETNQETNKKEVKEKNSILKPPADVPLETWLDEIKVKRTEILKRKNERKSRRQELAKRHTAAAQERMRIISQLARIERGNDEFGMDDNDWDVYKVINRDQDSDSETENEKLLECDNILRHHDPTFEEHNATSGTSADHYQLHAGVETIRAPELFFQPSMIGSPECGLAELIQFVLKLFNADEQQRMVNTIFLTGGCSKFSGLKERLSKELLENRPFESTYNIYEADMPELDAWLGARDFAQSNDFKASLTTKEDFAEKGSEYFKTHAAGNYYYPTPR